MIEALGILTNHDYVDQIRIPDLLVNTVNLVCYARVKSDWSDIRVKFQTRAKAEDSLPPSHISVWKSGVRPTDSS